MERVARYFIAQHVADPLRNEPRNIGVIVAVGNERTARFIGDTGAGKVDGTKVRFLQYPDVYRQWVSHWWSLVKADSFDLDRLSESSKEHYRMIDAGEVANIGSDSVHDVANYLYAAMVSEGNLALALGGDDDIESAPLQEDISEAFAAAAILSDNESTPSIPHPVQRGKSVRGKASKPHHPAFVQDNGELLVADAVDLTTSRQAWARDRSGLLAFMFSDIRAEHPNANAVSIIRVTAEGAKSDKIAYAMSLLESTSRLVNWLDTDARNTFIRERVAAATHD